ncbi:MAG: SAM-dependent methyltransferase [Phycisphaerales bacterium]
MAPRRVLHDKYFKQAKEEGYLARSAYKLKELQQRFGLIRKGDRVLDLGCAPGAWLQVALEVVGPDGVVVGLDLKEVDERLVPGAFSMVGDAFEIDPKALMGESGKPFDVVLSDMAPNTSGHGDDLRSSHLCHRVLDVVGAVLRPGGNMAMKILEGAMYNEVLQRTKGMFPDAKGFKPKASREVSREMYIVGTRHRPA